MSGGALEEEGRHCWGLGVDVGDTGGGKRGEVDTEKRAEACVFGTETGDLEFARFCPVDFGRGRLRIQFWLRLRLWFWAFLFLFWCWVWVWLGFDGRG